MPDRRLLQAHAFHSSSMAHNDARYAAASLLLGARPVEPAANESPWFRAKWDFVAVLIESDLRRSGAQGTSGIRGGELRFAGTTDTEPFSLSAGTVAEMADYALNTGTTSDVSRRIENFCDETSFERFTAVVASRESPSSGVSKDATQQTQDLA